MARPRRTHQINLDLRGADRNPWRNGPVTLKLQKFGNRGYEVEYFRTPQGARDSLVCEPDWFPLQIHRDLDFDQGEVYDLIAKADGHHQNHWQIKRRSFNRQNGRNQPLELKLILIPKGDPLSPDLDDGFGTLEQQGSPLVQGISNAQYTNLQPSAQMALLNIEAKLRETKIDGIPLIDSVTGLQTKEDGSPAVDPDRIYVKMRSGVKDALKNVDQRDRAQFKCAPGHPEVEGLGAHSDSWKHRAYPRGNLHLSFSARPINSNLEYSVDVDIDLERGNRHAGEVVANRWTGHKTDQAIVYSLLYTQGIEPKYTLDP